VPKTPAGKIFTMFYVFVGISIFLVLGKVVIGEAMARQSHRQAKRQAKRQQRSD